MRRCGVGASAALCRVRGAAAAAAPAADAPGAAPAAGAGPEAGAEGLRPWALYRDTLRLAREHVRGPDRHLGVLRIRNAVRLEYLRYRNAKGADDTAALLQVHCKVNRFIEWWWQTWEDPIDNPRFAQRWHREAADLGRAEARERYAHLLRQRVEAMREFNQHIDQLLSSRPPVPPAPPTPPKWAVP
eukprot:TRINITY_DN19116_c0_g1_i1.p2 TRINITY_DN19116_c0_g1~~TRINITY_DN19116_c0_g1_i1.p2  ORF type:complete len:187 (+),score=42.57 TRINITY_DN19116_c0_g1_i1:64-624(+)